MYNVLVKKGMFQMLAGKEQFNEASSFVIIGKVRGSTWY